MLARALSHINLWNYSQVAFEDSDGVDSLMVIGLNGHGHGHSDALYLNFGTTFYDFTVDVIQKLVVLIEARWETPTLARFHFRSIIDGEPHPLARHSTVSIQLDNPTLRPGPISSLELRTEVSGRLFIAGCGWRYTGCHLYEVLLFDWVSGALLGRIDSKVTITAGFVLLDGEHLAVYSATTQSQSAHPDLVTLAVYQVPSLAFPTRNANGHFQTRVYGSLVPTLVLEFPPIQKGLNFQLTCPIRPTLGVGRLVFDGPTKFACSRLPMLDVQISLYEEDEHELGVGTPYCVIYQIYISTHHLFNLLAQQGHKATLSWNEWGPRATRWFVDEHNKSPLVGSRCIQWVNSEKDNRQRLSSIEFNPLSVEAYLTPSPSARDEISDYRPSIHEYRPLESNVQQVGASGPGKENRASVVTIGSDDKTIFQAGFEQPIESYLPYRITTQQDLIHTHWRWILEGRRLIGYPVRTGPDWRSPPLSVYAIH
ncbi:ABC transporter C family member 13 [Rhizoctonia solani]|uniref:ABC transporter C family member 13 n=1 Tax=Rhizoctonia solani TaxID=456999 RepID=A0A0K6FZF2_9AGAM|nr:ABC transporter C family member 13 [Rhizoctonia solani]